MIGTVFFMRTVIRGQGNVASLPHFRSLKWGRQEGVYSQESETVKREIEATDKAIDKLVYELYGLSEEEIGIVEG